MGQSEENRSVPREKTLCYERYKSYYKALVENDTAAASILLSGATASEKDAMLNGTFDFGDDTMIAKHRLGKILKPLFVATLQGSMDIIELLLREGADLYQRNFAGGNILHCLVGASSLDNSYEKRAVEIYKRLVSTLEKVQITKLLMQEKDNGLRPLEMAVNLGVLTLFEVMQFTHGVYVTKSLERGLLKEEWIDITEYETYDVGHRRAKSPALIMAFLDKQVLMNPEHKRVLQSDFVQNWMNAKFNASMMMIIFWAFFRIIYSIFFYIYITGGQRSQTANNISANGSNPYEDQGCENTFLYFKTDDTMTTFMLGVLMFHSALSVVSTIIECIKFRKDKLHLYHIGVTNTKNVVMDNLFYTLIHIGTNVLYIVGTLLVICGNDDTRLIVYIIIAFTCIFSTWSLMFFIQVLPSIGFFAVAMQRMMKVLWHFILVFVITFLPFPHAFYKVLEPVDTSNGCTNKDFSPDVVSTYYNSFTVLLNMVDFTQYRVMITEDGYFVLLFLHVGYVFTLAILLINFLIALLSSSVSEVMENKDTIMTIQKLSVIYQTERFMEWLSFFKPVWKYLQRRQFHIKGGRYYLIKIQHSLLTNNGGQTFLDAGGAKELR